MFTSAQRAKRARPPSPALVVAEGSAIEVKRWGRANRNEAQIVNGPHYFPFRFAIHSAHGTQEQYALHAEGALDSS